MHFRLGCFALRPLGFAGRKGNTMILARLAVAAYLATVATAPHANPTLLPALSIQQRSAAMRPLMRSATECIARTVSADPRFGKPNADLGDLIVDSMPHCAIQVRTMIEAYDRYFGDGEGEAFFMGPYLDLLPSAVGAINPEGIWNPAMVPENSPRSSPSSA